MAFLKTFVAAGLILAASIGSAVAQDHPEAVHIHDAYARVTGGIGKTGAAFFILHNNTQTDDRLVGAASDVAQRVELHTHKDAGDGVMKMVQIEGGIPLEAGADHALERGGDHVMLMGLTRELNDGDRFVVTLSFEKAGEVPVEIIVDNARPAECGAMGHCHMKHGG